MCVMVAWSAKLHMHERRVTTVSKTEDEHIDALAGVWFIKWFKDLRSMFEIIYCIGLSELREWKPK